jgi:hypothetical protein
MYYNIFFYLTVSSSGNPEDDDGGGIYEVNESYSDSARFIAKVDLLATDSGSIETNTTVTTDPAFP